METQILNSGWPIGSRRCRNFPLRAQQRPSSSLWAGPKDKTLQQEESLGVDLVYFPSNDRDPTQIGLLSRKGNSLTYIPKVSTGL